MVQTAAAITLVGLWSSRRRFRPGRAAAFLAVALCLVVSGCSGPRPETTTLKQADRLVLYEGLPHQMYEPKALEAEKKAKSTVTATMVKSMAAEGFPESAAKGIEYCGTGSSS